MRPEGYSSSRACKVMLWETLAQRSIDNERTFFPDDTSACPGSFCERATSSSLCVMFILFSVHLFNVQSHGNCRGRWGSGEWKQRTRNHRMFFFSLHGRSSQSLTRWHLSINVQQTINQTGKADEGRLRRHKVKCCVSLEHSPAFSIDRAKKNSPGIVNSSSLFFKL